MAIIQAMVIIKWFKQKNGHEPASVAVNMIPDVIKYLDATPMQQINEQ